MRNLYGPSLVEGQATATVIFKELTTGQATPAEPDPATGRFRIMLPEGKYSVHSADVTLSRTFLPGASYTIDLRPEKTLDFDISATASGKGGLIIKVSARGSGNHHFSIRTDNLVLTGAHAPGPPASAATGPRKELNLSPGRSGIVEWPASILSKDEPWVLVVIPDDDLSQRQELTGN